MPLKINSWLSYSVRRGLLDNDLERIKNCFKGKVLEVGCGKAGRRGRFLPPLASGVSWTYADLDIRKDPHICLDIHNTCFKDAVFDTVVCLEVLEYAVDPRKSISELKRILKDNGSLILSVPFMHRYDNEHDFWRISDHAFRYLLKKENMKIEYLLSQGSAFCVMASILKNVVYAVPVYSLRLFLGLFVFFPVSALLLLDGFLARKIPLLTTFSTGYLLVARKEK